MSYYRGAQPDAFRSGSPWPEANFETFQWGCELGYRMAIFARCADASRARARSSNVSAAFNAFLVRTKTFETNLGG